MRELGVLHEQRAPSRYMVQRRRGARWSQPNQVTVDVKKLNGEKEREFNVTFQQNFDSIDVGINIIRITMITKITVIVWIFESNVTFCPMRSGTEKPFRASLDSQLLAEEIAADFIGVVRVEECIRVARLHTS